MWSGQQGHAGQCSGYRMEDLTSDDGEDAIRAEAFSYYHAEQYVRRESAFARRMARL